MRYGCTRRDTPLYGYCPYITSFIRLLSVFCVAMWLTALLLGARWTPGKQWIGKHRRVLKMTDTRRRNQAERAAQIKRVGSRASVGLREMCVPIIPIDNTVSCMVYQCVCLSAYYCNTCLLLYGLVFYISPAEGFAIGIKISTPTYTVQRTEWQPRLLVLVNLNQFTSSLSHFDISSHRYF